ncbi:TonB family protein [Sulfurimonas sp. MAG313]|nr:energy transducer TonB [Sulfurimonas sp. MAG313]MDF1880025.1 TonB family protein [Sulfurimonas sp. MAG313]
MNYMISNNDNKLIEGSTYKIIDFVQLQQKELDPEVKKELPPEPKKEEVPPKLLNKVVQSKSTQDMQEQTPLNLDIPSLSSGAALGNGAPRGLASMKMAKMDSALTPMVQIKPAYPSRAKRMKIEGYVTVQLNVDATGRVLSTKILKSVPKGIFDKSVKKSDSKMEISS